MIIRLLRWLFSFVGFVVTLVWVGAVVELVGLWLYLKRTNEAALDVFLDGVIAGNVGLTEVVAFVLASPDRVLVAVILAVVSVYIVRVIRSGRGIRTGGGRSGGGGDGGGFGGFGGGGDGGGDGGGGGGGE